MKAFLNRDDVDFENVEDLDPVQVCVHAAIPTAAIALFRCDLSVGAYARV
jgi:hypothetical protein